MCIYAQAQGLLPALPTLALPCWKILWHYEYLRDLALDSTSECYVLRLVLFAMQSDLPAETIAGDGKMTPTVNSTCGCASCLSATLRSLLNVQLGIADTQQRALGFGKIDCQLQNHYNNAAWVLTERCSALHLLQQAHQAATEHKTLAVSGPCLKASVQELDWLLCWLLAGRPGASWSERAALQLWPHPDDQPACMRDTCRHDLILSAPR